jgi:hypothetical protein
VTWARDKLATGLIMLFDPRCDDTVVDLLVEHARDDEQAFDLLVEAWELLTFDENQSQLAELTTGWSIQRDRGRIDAVTLARAWAPIARRVLSGPPEAAFVAAMTPDTRADTLQVAVTQTTSIRLNGHGPTSATLPDEQTRPDADPPSNTFVTDSKPDHHTPNDDRPHPPNSLE